MNWLGLSGTAALFLSAFGTQPGDLDHIGDPDAVPEQQHNDPETYTQTLELDRDQSRRLTVPVTIMGQGPFDFMVDTGAQATVLSTALADQLGLIERQSATLVGMASTRAVETAFIPEFGLGNRTFPIRTAPLIEAANIGSADGILGLDSLQNQRVLLDFEHRRMIVSETFENGGANSYSIVVRARERLGQLIIHRARVNGVATAVLIDTGASSSVGNLALQERLRNRGTVSDTTITDVNGVQITSPTQIARRLQMGSMEISNFPVSFADSPTFAALDLVDRPAMILGMNELRMFRRVAIDFRNSRVLFDIPGDAAWDQRWNFSERATRLGGN